MKRVIKIREAAPEEYASIARIIAEHNHNPESHCIQSSSTDDPAAIEEEIAELYAKDELRFVVAQSEGKLVGFIGCEFDRNVGRGWMRGPFLTKELWDSLPGELLEKLLTALPPQIRRLDSFLNQAHTRGNRFYLENGFQHGSEVHVYLAKASQLSEEIFPRCPEIAPGQETAFSALHELAFPSTFIDGQGILKQLDEDHKLFVVAKDSTLDGYIYVSVDRYAGEGYIEFIAVQPELRGRGIGKVLLLCALDWCFNTRGLPEVGLTVHEDLANAQSLYASVGFKHLYTGINTRREW